MPVVTLLTVVTNSKQLVCLLLGRIRGVRAIGRNNSGDRQ